MTIIRNNKGFVLGSCVKVQHGSLVFMAEARASVHGLSFAVDLGFHHVLLERDLRDNNQVAHAIAALGKHLTSDTYWFEDVPLEVLSLVEADRRNISPP
ncbi:hypothetical protein V6N13_020114 [Hibiscus sabdariffa]|uniref:RNase H type-1 domain-containing protein n=1 Tax=Hibiscus sabdariffa TaxID=183260 RepID=A0ABR2ESL5_9ROSI